jgi:hypothetical protein
MTIVPIGSLSLQVPHSGAQEFVLAITEQIRAQAVHLAGRILEESLEIELERFLGRAKPSVTIMVKQLPP